SHMTETEKLGTDLNATNRRELIDFSSSPIKEPKKFQKISDPRRSAEY
ncbi:16914_t:CDS:1, partial [Gigaspora rosea]